MSSDSGDSDGYGSGERGFKVKHKDKKDKDKKDKKDKDKKEKKDKGDKDKDKDKKDKDKGDKDKDKDKDKKDKDKGDKDKDKKDKDKGDKDKDKDKKDKDKDTDKKEKDKKDKDKDKEKDKDKDKDKDKKDKKDKHDEHSGSHSGFGGGSHLAMGGGAAAEFLSSSGHDGYRSQSDAGAYPGAPPPYPPPHDQSQGFVPPPADFKSPSQFASNVPPHPPMSSQAPPSGYRVPLQTGAPFPPANQSGPPVAYDADGISPVFIGSALFESSVQPCKIGPHLQPTPAAIAYGGSEVNHNGRYDLLPFVPDQMEWVPAQYGQIPPGRRPIEGGYEENGGKLYHAIANVNGIRVPGKTGEHLGGASVSFGGQELPYQQYEILCWKY